MAYITERLGSIYVTFDIGLHVAEGHKRTNKDAKGLVRTEKD